jgi:hypothetical protein
MKMKHQLKPCIESLEAKALLSHVALGLSGIPIVPIVPIEPVTPPGKGMDVTVTTNQASYTSGELVRMTFTETNNTGHIAFVDMGPSIDGFSVTYGGKTIWRSNAGFSAQFIVRRPLLPGQSITLKANWIARSQIGAYDAHNQLALPPVEAAFSIANHPAAPDVRLSPTSRGR